MAHDKKTKVGTAEAILYIIGGGVILSGIYALYRQFSKYEETKGEYEGSNGGCNEFCAAHLNKIKCNSYIGVFSFLVSLLGIGVWLTMAKTMRECGKGETATKSILALILTPVVLFIPLVLFMPSSCLYPEKHPHALKQ